MQNVLLWSFVLLFTSMPAKAQIKTLFEAYYKMKAGEQHIGYYIQRYELDQKKKQFISTYYLRTNKNGGNISESLKAVSSNTLKPVSYQFTTLQNKLAKTIDANVRTGKKKESILQVKVNENGKLRVYEKKLEKGTFFSTFLIYLLLQGDKGIQPGAKYKFRAIAEEDGKAFPGEVYVDSETKKMGVDVYKILYTFKRTQFVNFINQQGETLMSVSPAMQLSTELVTDPKQATEGMAFDQKNLRLLFGNVPAGKTHKLKAAAANQTPATTLAPKDSKSSDHKEKGP